MLVKKHYPLCFISYGISFVEMLLTNGTCSNLFILQSGGRSGTLRYRYLWSDNGPSAGEILVLTYWLFHMQAGYTRSASIPVSAHPMRSMAIRTRFHSTGKETVGGMVKWVRPGKGTVSGIWGEEV